MKLNNKGFAFSTLLYGILAVIIVILMIIFSLYTTAEDRSYYYSSMFEESLNRCVEQEIVLENCYASGAASCDTDAYFSCMGLEDNTITGTKKILKDYLLTKVVSSGGGLTKIENSELEYIYKGESVDNYITFSGDTWRIIGISPQGEVKIGLFKTNGSLKWDNGNSSEWSTSSLNNYLNNSFYNELSDAYMISKRNHYIGRLNPEVAMDKPDVISNEMNATYSANVGLLSAVDYIEAPVDQCTTGIIGNETCKSWIYYYESWLINSPPSSYNKAYYIIPNGKIQADDLSSTHNYIPVVYLSPETEIIEGGGDGTMGSPYKLGK